MIGDGLDLQARDLAFLGRAQLGVDVVVAGERVGLEVLGPVFDPLDRLAGEERGRDGQDVARIDRHLAPEPATDVVRLDPDVVLVDGQAGARCDEREDRPDGVRRLAGHVQGELLADRIPVSDAAASLDRGHVDARDVDVLRHRHLGSRERGIRGGPIARFPVPDVVGLLVRAAVRAQDERVRLERLERIGDDRQRLVIHEHGRDAIGGGVAGRGDDRRDFLGLVHDGVHREHHLHVAGQRRHPVELVALEVLAGDDRGDAGDLQGLRAVDRLDLRVGIGAANDVQPQLARQVDVLDVLALATDDPWVFLALDRMTHAADGGARAGLSLCRHIRHSPLNQPRPANRSGSRQPPPSRRQPAGWTSRCSRSRYSDTGCR